MDIPGGVAGSSCDSVAPSPNTITSSGSCGEVGPLLDSSDPVSLDSSVVVPSWLDSLVNQLADSLR